MPIITIEIVARPEERLEPALAADLAADLAQRIAPILGARPGSTWVKLSVIPAEYYAEDDPAASEGVYPLFVSILKAQIPSPEQMQQEVTRLTAAVAQACGRPPENVHIIYLPPGAGRVAFGGKIVPP